MMTPLSSVKSELKTITPITYNHIQLSGIFAAPNLFTLGKFHSFSHIIFYFYSIKVVVQNSIVKPFVYKLQNELLNKYRHPKEI